MATNPKNWGYVRAARANELTDDLLSTIRTWNSRRLVEVETVQSTDRRTVETVLRVAEQPPLDQWSLVVSEIIHHSRGALDALTWHLCRLGGAPVRPRKVLFPARMNSDDWPAVVASLQPMPAEFLSRIEDLQPFQLEEPETDGLGALIRMSNHDKHRGMIEASADVAMSAALNIALPKGHAFRPSTWEIPRLSLDDGLVTHRFSFDEPVILTPTRNRVQVLWQLPDPISDTVYSLDTFVQIVRSIPDTLKYIETGEGELND